MPSGENASELGVAEPEGKGYDALLFSTPPVLTLKIVTSFELLLAVAKYKLSGEKIIEAGLLELEGNG